MIDNDSHLVMCSSKRRSSRIEVMYKSFYKTIATKSKILIYVSDNDPELPAYRKIIAPEDLYVSTDRTMVQVLNFLSTELYPNLECYSEVNDDHEYITNGWDTLEINAAKAKNNWAIVYGTTLNLPSATLITGKVIRCMGFFFPREFVHGYVDNYIKEFGEETGLLTYVPEVQIEHHHNSFGKAPSDSTYQWVASKMGISEGIYQNWKHNIKQTHINTLNTEREKDQLNA